MDRFLEVTVLTDKSVANRCCEALEDALIPLMLQHVQIEEQRATRNGYRLLVPSQFTQRARRITEIARDRTGTILPLTPRTQVATSGARL
jgi:hypothetical protein